jgi:hypothetical protein
MDASRPMAGNAAARSSISKARYRPPPAVCTMWTYARKKAASRLHDAARRRVHSHIWMWGAAYVMQGAAAAAAQIWWCVAPAYASVVQGMARVRARRVDIVAARSVSMVRPLRCMRRSMVWRLRVAMWRRAGTLDSTHTHIWWYPERRTARARNAPVPPHHTIHEEAASAAAPAAHHVWPPPYSMTYHTVAHDMTHHMARIRAPDPRIWRPVYVRCAPASKVWVWIPRPRPAASGGCGRFYTPRVCPPSVWRGIGPHHPRRGGLAAAPPRMRGRPGTAPTIWGRARRVSGPCRRGSSPRSRARHRRLD